MPDRDEFDLTRDTDGDSAPVLSLRRRGRPTIPPETRSPSATHRHLVGRVRVPITAPPEPVSEVRDTLGWNEPPDVVRTPAHPPPGPGPGARSEPRVTSRTARLSTGLGVLLVLVLGATIALTAAESQTGAARAHHGPSARTEHTVSPLLNGDAVFDIRALAAEIKSLGPNIALEAERLRRHHAGASLTSRTATANQRSRSVSRHATAATSSAAAANNSAPATYQPSASTNSTVPPSSESTGGNSASQTSPIPAKSTQPPCYPSQASCWSP